MTRLFAHRGFHSTNAPQNTVASLDAAYENGFRGVEFDIWYLEEKLVLKHDHPKKEEIKNLPLFLEYLAHGNEMDYWCDFKNLDLENAKAALTLMKNQLAEARIDADRIYFAPYITDYNFAAKIFKIIREIFGNGAQLVAVCDTKNEEVLRKFLDENNVKCLSIFHKLIDKFFIKKFPDIEIFAWTVNDLERLTELEALSVRNYGTDNIAPQKYEAHKTKSSRT